ncbi:MAG: Ig-like domain-containing protein, partial [Ilumatobacteraceae bacterium]
PVTIPVTANDYDPDGEAIVVVDVGRPGHGTAEIGTASTVVYNPEPGYVGLDSFGYTIADGNGTEASAEVLVELLPADSNNQPPVGATDVAQTGPNTAVVVEVLLNDIDPERDPLRIGSFSPPEGSGDVTETVGPSGLPALRFEPIDGFEGAAIFSYQPIDSFEAVGDEVEVLVEVASAGDANREPLVRPDAIRLRRNDERQLPVLVNDIDPDGDHLTLSVVEPLPPGLEVDVQGEQLEIVARAGSAGLVPFEYAVDDGHGHRVRGAVLVDVIDDREPNRPPVVSPDSDTAVVGRSVVIDVTANDTDPDGDPLAVLDVSQPEDDRGDVEIVGRNQVEFTPTELVEDESSTARFTYTVSDGHGHEVAGDVTVTVLPEPLPEPPYAQDDSTFTYVDEPVTIDVLRNDGDPSGERPTLVGAPGCASGGSAVVTADSQVRFDPPPGRSGAFRCTYEVTNSQGLRASASIIVSVREPEITNEAPDAVDDTLTLEVEESGLIDVSANDSDPDGFDGELTVVSSTAPTLGTAERTGNIIRFTAGTETGFTSISYQIADPDGAVSQGRLAVIITEPSNLPPTALPDRNSIEAGAGAVSTFDVLANDFDPDDTPGGLSVVGVAQLSGGGDVSLLGNLVTIVPDPDFVGEITAEYTITDGDGLTDSSRVNLAVLEPLNRPPVAVDDSAEVANGGSTTVSVLFNDNDPDGDSLSLSITGGPDSSLGSASVTSDRAIAFSATPGASGTASISYEISDGELSDSAVLRVTVLPCVDSTPIATDGFLSTGYQQPIAVDPADYASNGTLVDVVGPPGYAGGLYTPPAGENGNVTIAFAVENSCEQRATGLITIDVNQAPDAQPVSLSLARGEVREVPVSSLASDDEQLVITGATGAPAWVDVQTGRLVIDTTGVSPLTTSWDVTVADPGGLQTVVPVSVTISNAAPIAAPDTIEVASGSPASLDVVANDSDPDGDNAALRVQSAPTSVAFGNGETGTVKLLGDGRTLRVDPKEGRGNASFTYTVVDADGAVSAPATVTVVGPVANTPPFAEDQSVSVITGEQTLVELAVGDADGDEVEVVNIGDPSGVVLDVDGRKLYIKVPTDGVVSVTYQVDDDEDLSRVATLTITASTPTTTTAPPTTPPPTTAPPTTPPPTTAPPTTPPPTTAPPTTPPTTAPPTTPPPTTDP